MPIPSLPDLEFEDFWRSLRHPECYIVYGLNSEDELLYVGITSSFKGRLRDHFESRERERRVDMVECHGPYDERTARRRECEWIDGVSPTHNVQRYDPKPTPRRLKQLAGGGLRSPRLLRT